VTTEQIVVLIASPIVGAFCAVLGYWAGQRKVSVVATDWKSRYDTQEALTALLRGRVDQISEELGNIYAALQMQDAEAQKKQMADLEVIQKQMREAILTGSVPMPQSPLHPKVDPRMRQQPKAS